MSDLRELLDRMNTMAKRGIALNEMAQSNVIELVEHIEDDDKRQVFFDRSNLELDHELATNDFIAKASRMLDYMRRHQENLSVAEKRLFLTAEAARLHLEDLAEQLINRALMP